MALGPVVHNSLFGVETVADPEPQTPLGGSCEDLRDLVCRLAQGDQTALSTLYDATSRPVYSLALRILGHSADAEEVTLDVFSQAWRQACRYDAGRGDVIAWLLNLTRSRAIDRIRSRKTAWRNERGSDSMAELADSKDSPEESTALAQRAGRVRAALANLPAEQRTVIELAYFEGLSHAEIAEKTRLPLGTAKSRIRLALSRLRESLGPLTAGGEA
jgi:RNA polymerase sigma-70 factor (ECF subfamily)